MIILESDHHPNAKESDLDENQHDHVPVQQSFRELEPKLDTVKPAWRSITLLRTIVIKLR